MCYSCNNEKNNSLENIEYYYPKNETLIYLLNRYKHLERNIKNYFKYVLKSKTELSEKDILQFVSVMFKNNGKIISTKKIPKIAR